MVKNVKTGVYTYNSEETAFNFYTSLSAKQKVSFINAVVDTVVDDNYYDCLVDLLFDFEIIDKFTDVDLSIIVESGYQIDIIENFVDETNIAEIVKANVEQGLMEELRKSVDLCIEYRTGIHKNPLSESLSNLLDTIEKKVSGIDTENMMKMAKILSSVSGELTMDKLIESYSKSEIFKEKFKNILPDKNKDEVNTTNEVVKNTRGRKKTTAK